MLEREISRRNTAIDKVAVSTAFRLVTWAGRGRHEIVRRADRP